MTSLMFGSMNSQNSVLLAVKTGKENTKKNVQQAGCEQAVPLGLHLHRMSGLSSPPRPPKKSEEKINSRESAAFHTYSIPPAGWDVLSAALQPADLNLPSHTAERLPAPPPFHALALELRNRLLGRGVYEQAHPWVLCFIHC